MLKDFGDNQPMMYVSFSHYAGSQIMCNWVVNTLGTEGTYAMNRGVPGIVDDQRSGGFRDCLAKNSDWNLAYEHYGNFEREAGFRQYFQYFRSFLREVSSVAWPKSG